jgi:hypothetical protein
MFQMLEFTKRGPLSILAILIVKMMKYKVKQ